MLPQFIIMITVITQLGILQQMRRRYIYFSFISRGIYQITNSWYYIWYVFGSPFVARISCIYLFICYESWRVSTYSLRKRVKEKIEHFSDLNLRWNVRLKFEVRLIARIFVRDRNFEYIKSWFFFYFHSRIVQIVYENAIKFAKAILSWEVSWILQISYFCYIPLDFMLKML